MISIITQITLINILVKNITAVRYYNDIMVNFF
jgi:hypothetical protein